MNLRTFLSSLFAGSDLNGELDQIRESARADAQLVVGTYVEEFKREASSLLTEHCQQFRDPEEGNGVYPQPDPLDYEEQISPGRLSWLADLQASTRHELLNLAKQRGLTYTRTVTKVKLIKMLESV